MYSLTGGKKKKTVIRQHRREENGGVGNIYIIFFFRKRGMFKKKIYACEFPVVSADRSFRRVGMPGVCARACMCRRE